MSVANLTSLESRRTLIQRLKYASVAEVAYRLRQVALHRRLRRQIRNGGSPLKPPRVPAGNIDSLQMPHIALDKTLADGHQFDNAAVRQFLQKWRYVFFADVRCGERNPDIRSVWEEGRLQQPARRLLQPAADDTERQAGRKAVLDWIRDNPFLLGPHYMSAMECGLRVPVFFYCLKAGPPLSDEERTILLRAIYEHAWWIERNLSLYSSLGNHTVCECAGLIFAGAVFRNHDSGRRWLGTGCRLLDRELAHQVLNDGGPVEQSLAYHRFVLDFYWLSADFLEQNRLHDCSDWKNRLEKGEIFLSYLSDNNGHFPSIGDGDDGYTIAPGLIPQRGSVKRPVDKIKTFPDSGFTAIRSTDDLLFTFNHGPLGMTPLCNHGHADALSITLSLQGQSMLVDPGTYRYNTAAAWRQYFKGTRAHNTVTIDGRDQADQETGFIWGEPYACTVLARKETPGGYYMKARHDGYRRLEKPVWHTRTLAWFPEEGFVTKDTFEGKGRHFFELNFHCHPDTTVLPGKDYWTIAYNDKQLFLASVSGDGFAAESGCDHSPFGWFSPAYGLKIPCTVLSCHREGSPRDVAFTTAIWLKRPPEKDVLKDRLADFERQAAHT